MHRFFRATALLIGSAVALVACQTGSVSVPLITSTATGGAFSGTATQSIAPTPAGGATTVTLPSAGGFAGTAVLPAPLTATTATLTETIQNGPPSDGTPALAIGRAAQSVRTTRSQLPHTTLLYIDVSSSVLLKLSNSPTFTLSVPAADIVTGTTYYVAYYDAQTLHDWILPFEGPASVSGTTLTFPTNNAGTFAFPAGASNWFALVAFAPGQMTPGPSASPSPGASGSPTSAPTPTASPTASSSPTPSATPSTVPTATPSPTPPTATPAPTATPVPSSSGAPTIADFNPTSGPVGTTVVIDGTGFIPPLSVIFAGNASAAGSFTATKITVTVPSGALTGPIVVTTQSGQATTATNFVVTAPTPSPTPSP